MPDLILLERLTAALFAEATDAYEDGQHELSLELLEFADLCQETASRAAASD